MIPVPLENHLRTSRDRGEKALVPYVTGGYAPDWLDVVRAVAASGATAVEIGIPFSDPVMDGPTIQEASVRALEAGTTPLSVISGLRAADVGVPIVVMTYYNLVIRMGCERFAHELADAGVAGAVVPDLPLEEVEEWAAAADAVGIATVLLGAPTTPKDRLAAICERSRGFLYAIGLLGVTGERTELAASATTVAALAESLTDLPVLVGVGVSTPEQSRAVSNVADGAIVGSALVRRLLDGAGPEGAAAFVAEHRAALDGG